MSEEEIVKLLREIDAYAKARAAVPISVWQGAGEVADAVEQMAEEIARLRDERRSISTLLGKVESLEADNTKLREERRWVPVGERLPEGNSKVLTLGLQRYPVVCSFFQFDQSFRDGGVVSGVTHWMPTPPGPEAAG